MNKILRILLIVLGILMIFGGVRKITGALGWSPKYTFQTGMAQTIEWYLQHREWMDKIVSGEYMKYYEKMYAGR